MNCIPVYTFHSFLLPFLLKKKTDFRKNAASQGGLEGGWGGETSDFPLTGR